MIYTKISVPTLLAIAYIGGVVGESEYDAFFGSNDALSGSNDASDTDNIFDDAGARITIIIEPPTPTRTRRPKPPKPDTVKPHTHTPPRSTPTSTPTLVPTETPTSTPTLVPTETPTSTPTLVPTKTIQKRTGICAVPDRGSERRPSRCSSARNAAYEEAVSLFQSRFYDCDCYEVGQFSVSAIDELLERKYKADEKGNSRQEALKKCARDGVERYINDAAKACIGPSTCQDIGFLVTDLIITDFCALPSTTRYNNNLLKECASEAKQVCRGDLFGALIDFLKGGYECPAKDQFGSAADAKDFMKDELSKQCRARVEELLFD